METYGVWKKVPKTSIPSGRRCVKCKWVLEIKRSGVFRARLVACGYSQVAGVDFTETHCPVINDTTFRIMLVVQMIQGYCCKLIDIETAFLHGELGDGEEIYMNCPEGMDSDGSECLLLLKTIYGLVQSSRAYSKKFKEVLLGIGLSRVLLTHVSLSRSQTLV